VISAKALLEARLGQRTFAQRALVIAADVGESPIERLLCGLEQHDRQAGIDEAHRDAAAHRSGADDADLAIGRRDGFGHVLYMRAARSA
jgi:hypothetical protein